MSRRTCLVLAGGTIEKNLELLAAERYAPDVVELRADFLAEISDAGAEPAQRPSPSVSASADGRTRPAAEDRPATKGSVTADGSPADVLRAAARRIRMPTILTIRRPADGGSFTGREADRLELLRSAGPAFDYVDLELDTLRLAEGKALAAELRRVGVAIICSYHDFAGMPSRPLGELLAELMELGDIGKLAVRPTSTADLLVLQQAAALSALPGSSPTPGSPAASASSAGRAGGAQASSAKRDGDAESASGIPRYGTVLLGMGSFGFATRVLPERFGSLWTYAAPLEGAVAPGQVSLTDLNELYRFSDIHDRAPTFAVVADPVMHSRSPHYHNPEFRKGGVDAVYLPLHVDDFDLFPRLADGLGILGASVTVPHKAAAARLADSGASESVRALGVANTLLWDQRRGAWRAENTDVLGFLAGLATVPTHATVLGAGGSTRAVVYALLSCGVRVKIINRTVSKAEALADDAAAWFSGGATDGRPVEVAPTPPHGDPDNGDLGPYRQLIVNTTSLGMTGGPAETGDPASWYTYHGDETCYDIVYTPALTPFLRHARRAGCTTIGGSVMFAAQAEAQQRLFREVYAAATP